MMNWKNFLPLVAVAAVVTSCSPVVSTQLTAAYPPQPAGSVVVVEEEQVPNSAQPVGKIAVIDRGLGFKCEYDKLLEIAKAQSAACGANGLVLTEPKTANYISPCDQVYGTMILMTDNHVDPQQPNPVMNAVRRERVALANYRRKTKLPTNILKVNVGPSFMTSTFETYYVDDNNNMRKSKQKAKTGLDFSIDYARLWRTGWGVGANLIHSKTSYDGDVDLGLTYLGPSLLWSRKTTEGWRWEFAIGLGYSHYSMDTPGAASESGGGFGTLSKIGVDYTISDKFAIGAELNSISQSCKAPAGWDDDNFGFSRINLMIGARYYF